MSKNKSKIVKWEYVTEPKDEYVALNEIKRTHAPIEKSLTFEPEYQDYCIHLRPCVQGLGESGKPVKTLYCIRDGRFFTHHKDGWNEVLPCRSINAPKSKNGGGGSDCLYMRDFGNKSCHRLIAFAWCNPPQNAAELQVDHLNGDHKNWTADNLQWVTAAENRRRANLFRKLRKAGFDPASCTTAALRIILNAI